MLESWEKRALKKECRAKKKNVDSFIKKSSDDDFDALFIFPNNVSDDTWLIDLGASYHMAPHKEWFSSYKGRFFPQ